MTTTLVDLKTLTSLAKIAAAHGTSEQFMDMALEFAASAEIHITHLERLLEGQGITCSCQTLIDAVVDDNCQLHGYVEMDDPQPESRGWDEQAQAIGYRDHQHYLEENADPMSLEDQQLPPEVPGDN